MMAPSLRRDIAARDADIHRAIAEIGNIHRAIAVQSKILISQFFDILLTAATCADFLILQK